MKISGTLEMSTGVIAHWENIADDAPARVGVEALLNTLTDAQVVVVEGNLGGVDEYVLTFKREG